LCRGDVITGLDFGNGQLGKHGRELFRRRLERKSTTHLAFQIQKQTSLES